MTLHTKESLQYATAIISLIIGFVFGGVSLFLPPQGVIDNSVLMLFGQVLIFVGCVFGLRSYVDASINSKLHKYQNHENSTSTNSHTEDVLR